MNRYQLAAQKLRIVKQSIDDFLAKGRELMYKDMKEVYPGVWIHKDYNNLNECLTELESWLPVK